MPSPLPFALLAYFLPSAPTKIPEPRGPFVQYGDVRFSPGFERRGDSLVSLDSVQTVSFRGTRWTVRDFYVRFSRHNKDLALVWAEPDLAGPAKKTGAVYGPFSWRDGKPTKDLDLAAPEGRQFRYHLEVPAKDSVEAWLLVDSVFLAKDGKIAIPQEKIHLGWSNRKGRGNSFDQVRGPLDWTGSFPRLRLYSGDPNQEPRFDTAWLDSGRLLARKVRVCEGYSACANHDSVRLSFDRRIVDIDLGPGGNQILSDKSRLRWTGILAIRDGVPRIAPGGKAWIAPPVETVDNPSSDAATRWSDSVGKPWRKADSFELENAAGKGLETIRNAVWRQGYALLQGKVRLDLVGDPSSRSLWEISQPEPSKGWADLHDTLGRFVGFHGGNIAGPVEPGKPAGRFRILTDSWLSTEFLVEPEHLPTASRQVTATLGHWGKAVPVGFAEGDTCHPLERDTSMDDLPTYPEDYFLRSTCLELARAPEAIEIKDLKDWGRFQPGRVVRLGREGRNLSIPGRWILSSKNAANLGIASLPGRLELPIRDLGNRDFAVDADALAMVDLEAPAGWNPFPGAKSFDPRTTLHLTLNAHDGTGMVSFRGTEETPLFWRDLDSTFQPEFRGGHAWLSNAFVKLGKDGKLLEYNFAWRTFGKYQRVTHPWGWILQSDRPVPWGLGQSQKGTTLDLDGRYLRIAWPPDSAKAIHSSSTQADISKYQQADAMGFRFLPRIDLPDTPVKIQLKPGSALLVDPLPATVGEYRTCVEAKACAPVVWPAIPDTGFAREWFTRAAWTESVQSGLDSSRARAYCRFRHRRLPASSEWSAIVESIDGRKDALETWSKGTPIGREHTFRNGPMPPGMFDPWIDGLSDLVGNGPIWCRDKLCEVGPDRHWFGRQTDLTRTTSPTDPAWSPGVRCVQDFVAPK